MNVQFQICGLCIMFLVIMFYKSHKNLYLYKETVFFFVACIMTVSLIGDIFSLIVIQYRSVLPSHLVNFICKSYVITLIWGAWAALLYITSDLTIPKKHKKITYRSALIVAVQSIIIYFLPIYIYENGDQQYTYGPAVLGVYAFVGLYIVSTLIVTFVFRNVLNPGRKFAIIVWMLIWILSATIQFFNSALLLVGFASALGVLILFMVMENPEGNIERHLGCFNSYALTEYLKQLYEDHMDFSLLEISFENEKVLEEHGVDINALMRKILNICEKNILVFKNINLGFVLISESTEMLENTQKTIAEEVAVVEILKREMLLTLVPQAGTFSNSEKLFQFLAFIKAKQRKEKTTIIVTDEDMVSQFKTQFLMKREIALALAEDRVEIFLQPIYSTHEKCFTSAEALVRIRKHNGEYLSPGLFIPVAENNGQILELGDRVFEKVCWLLKNTDAVKHGIRYIEINLSVIQCEKEDLSERLISITEKYQIDPRFINLEITETASISAQKILLENMKKLIDYGFTFSLDDFGKGQSNLMYVVEMPVSILKLDYDMSKAFFNTPKARQVVQAVVSMSHRMGLDVVAEGIESQEETEQITREGIDYIQGYYYSKPLPIQEFLELIAKRN